MIQNYIYRPKFYYLLTFSVTYTLWVTGAFVTAKDGRGALYILFMLPGLMAPFIISLIFILTSNRSDLKRDFLNRLINPKLIRPRILPFFLFIMPLTVIASIIISIPFGGAWDQVRFAEGFSFSAGMVPVLLLLILAAGFEELGWRGYAFDSLQSHYSLFKASLTFSILWSLWHFPLVFVKDSYQYEISHQSIWYAVNFFLSIVPMGMIISWICVKNRKSVIAAILFHFIVNMSQEALNMTQTTKCIESGVLLMVATGIVVYDRELFFKKQRHH